MRGVVLLTLLFAACTPSARPAGDWRFEGTPASGEIRVVPILHAYPGLVVRTDGYVTETLPLGRLRLRRERTAQVSHVPDAVGTALPGALHARLDPAWAGTFRVGGLPMGAKDRLEGALRKGTPDELESALSDAARSVGGDATLFCWVQDLQATPITTLGFPGDVVQSSDGPVLVDFAEEPYQVDAWIGMALVTAHGEIVLRYTEHSRAVLSPHRGPSRVGRDLASDLAVEISKMWPDDPRLWIGTEEEQPAPSHRLAPSAATSAWSASAPPAVPFGSHRP